MPETRYFRGQRRAKDEREQEVSLHSETRERVRGMLGGAAFSFSTPRLGIDSPGSPLISRVRFRCYFRLNANATH